VALCVHERRGAQRSAANAHAPRDDQQRPVERFGLAARQHGAQLSVPLVLEVDDVLGADEHAARSVLVTRHGDQFVGRHVDGVGELAHDVVQPEIELVKHELLLAVGVVARLVVDLETRKHGILKADVESDDVPDDRVRLVRLKR
jgi:hypothetical protein